jgi:hypothetical protein
MREKPRDLLSRQTGVVFENVIDVGTGPVILRNRVGKDSASHDRRRTRTSAGHLLHQITPSPIDERLLIPRKTRDAIRKHATKRLHRDGRKLLNHLFNRTGKLKAFNNKVRRDASSPHKRCARHLTLNHFNQLASAPVYNAPRTFILIRQKPIPTTQLG